MVGLAFILLMLVFRSILVPLTATLGFLLSVLATFGATVAIFQEGWGGGLISNPQPLVSFMPIFLIGVVFGLAMDYQVFLVTRMREDYVHGATATDAVRSGFRHGARVVSAAAIIMISVFAAFVAEPNAFIKSIGFALAAAVFFDAFVVRMVIIPPSWRCSATRPGGCRSGWTGSCRTSTSRARSSPANSRRPSGTRFTRERSRRDVAAQVG